MAERSYFYSVIRYVPRPSRGEFINVGVIVLSDDGREVATEFTDDWRRARAIGTRTDEAFLRQLSRQWKKSLRASAEVGQLFATGLGAEWLRSMYADASNLVQLSEPLRALAATAAELAHELYDDFVAVTKPAFARHTPGRRGLQLTFEGQLRRSGLAGAFERNFIAPGSEVADWRFDYAITNGRPLHLVQTLNFSLLDVNAILKEATYVAYARKDIAASALQNIPVSVIADRPAEPTDAADETQRLLMHEEIPLIWREDVPDLVDRLRSVLYA